MREILFAILGFVIGGGGVYFLSSAKLQRQLASAEGKLKRANRATDDMDNLRSQQLSQSGALQTAEAKIHSMEADYQAKVSKYEKQIQEQQASLQSYATQTQELQASLQSYETQIRELQNNHQQEIAALQSSLTQASPPSLPTATEVAPSPEPSQTPNWLGTVLDLESSPFEEEAFELPPETPEIADLAEPNLSDWTEEENLGEAENVREDESPWPSEQTSSFDDPFSPSLETPIAVEEENWVDAVDIPLEEVNLGEPDLNAWAEGDNAVEIPITNDFPPVLEEISAVDTTMDSLELPADFLADIPSDHVNLEPLTEELNAESDLDFLLELQQDDAITEDPDLLAFSEMQDLESLEGLSDLSAELELGSEDLPLLDMFPEDQADQDVLPELPLSEPGQSGETPFINFLDSTPEKSDVEFLEMLQTEEDDFSQRPSIEESDDLFGDLFSPEPSLSTTEMDDIFGQTNEPENPPSSEPGLEELFSDDALSLENWDLPGTGDFTKES